METQAGSRQLARDEVENTHSNPERSDEPIMVTDEHLKDDSGHTGDKRDMGDNGNRGDIDDIGNNGHESKKGDDVILEGKDEEKKECKEGKDDLESLCSSQDVYGASLMKTTPSGRRLTAFLTKMPLSESRKSLLYGVVIDNRDVKLVTNSVTTWGVLTVLLCILMAVIAGSVNGSFNDLYPGDIDSDGFLPGDMTGTLPPENDPSTIPDDLLSATHIVNGLIFFTVVTPFVGLAVLSAAIYAVRSAVTRRDARVVKISAAVMAVTFGFFFIMFIFAFSATVATRKISDSVAAKSYEYIKNQGGMGGATNGTTDEGNWFDPNFQVNAGAALGPVEWGCFALIFESLLLMFAVLLTLISTVKLYYVIQQENQKPNNISVASISSAL